jgi:RNase H-like domain found in reverse transcriptase/Reverse transcriptase (RNA-dependent DNA polymerase)/Chromo (CHRromatin Organisation MOdifier) domain
LDHLAPATIYPWDHPRVWDPGIPFSSSGKYLSPHDPVPQLYDPDNLLSDEMLSTLATATGVDKKEICRPLLCSGILLFDDGSAPAEFDKALLDTGAHGSNFISLQLFRRLPLHIQRQAQRTDRTVRMGNKQEVNVTLEIPLTVSILDSKGEAHQALLYFSIFEALSFDIVIGLIDLVGPLFYLFMDSLYLARQLLAKSSFTESIGKLTDNILHNLLTMTPKARSSYTRSVGRHRVHYSTLKSDIMCASDTSIKLQTLSDGSTVQLLSHPILGDIFLDNQVEDQLTFLSLALNDFDLDGPLPGETVPPWSLPLDAIAPEELETPEPLTFPEDILTYLSTTFDEAKSTYDTDLLSHVSSSMQSSCPRVMGILNSPLAHSVFIPQTWNGIKMDPVHLDIKPDCPSSIKAATRPIRPALYASAKAEFERMKTYFFTPSQSPRTSPLVIAPKETSPFIRICGDYRVVNQYITIPQIPIPNVRNSLLKAQGYKVFVDLDMTNSFHQIPIDEESSNILSVSTPFGQYRPCFMPEGVGPASGVLQSIVSTIFADFDDWIIVIYDNFLICANDYEDAADKLEKVLARCQEYGLVLKMKKSWIGTDTVNFFGYEISHNTISLSQSRKDAISAMLFPQNIKGMQSFLGATNFFHPHVPNYAKWASSLYECTNSGFSYDPTNWKKDYISIFEEFKVHIQEAAMLYQPNYDLPWVIRSDSSDTAVGAVLFQESPGADGTVIHQPIAFASHKYSGAAVNWDTYKKEAFAMYYAVTQFSYFLRGKEFLLETDHANLVWMQTSQVPIIIRWRVLMQSYNFKVRHIPGKQNLVADWLSRMYPSPVNLSSLTTSSNDSKANRHYPPLQEMFENIHGNRSLHHGAKRSYYELSKEYPGHGISQRVIQNLVSECPICQKDRLPIQPLPHSEITETIMHHSRSIGIDHITITPHSEEGHVGLLLVVEHDCKFPQAYPVKDYTALTVATVLFKHYCTFGSFTSLYSDPGSAFMAEVVAHLNKYMHIEHKFSLVGRHESNGTEHVNAMFVSHLRRLVHDERLTHQWSSDLVLPLINHALANSPNSELGGFSPSELKFGRIDSKYFKLPDPLQPGHSYGDFVMQLDRNLAAVREITATHQQSLRTSRHTSPVDHPQNQYQPGDLILFDPKEHSHSMRKSKLAPKLLGPYQVVKQIHNNIHCIHLIKKTDHTLFSGRVCPYIGSLASATKIAMLDDEEYIVESITTHRNAPPRGLWRPITRVEFLVRWEGYSPASDTWEPWSNLKHNTILHQYLKQSNLWSRIPPESRNDIEKLIH